MRANHLLIGYHFDLTHFLYLRAETRDLTFYETITKLYLNISYMLLDKMLSVML